MPANNDDSGEEGPDFPRRAVLGALGSGVGLAGLSGPAAGAVDLTGGEETDSRLSAAELARARVEQFALGQLTAKADCFDPNRREIYGPTDINAQSANGRLAVAVNGEGTMTVFRWPRPSFYDQLKYYTEGRDADAAIQVQPNQGAFLGIAADTGDGFETTWLREFDEIEQYYASDEGVTEAAFSDEIVTRYVDGDLGLDVRVRDVVTEGVDAFVRRVRVRRRGDSPVERAKLLAFENFNLVTEKVPQYPVQDWCLEEDNDNRARYVDRLDAIVNDAEGVDGSTGQRRSVAVAMGFEGETVGHQVGGDAYDPAAAPAGRGGPTQDAYDDAATGTLSGNGRYVGQTTGALATELAFGHGEGGVARETLVVAAGEDETEVAATLGTLRSDSFEAVRGRKEAWLADVLADAPMPDRDAIEAAEGEKRAEAILATIRRALVVLVTNYDRESGAVVASISTQPPYGEDWPRDGAFFNYVLQVIGRHDWSETRNRWYAEIQSGEAAQEGDLPGAVGPGQLTSGNTPPSNWNMCYYGDGVPGGPIPYQIDTTGLVVWSLYDHYEATGDDAYLRAVYPAIRRAADFLVECRDPTNGLQCRAFEDDRFAEPDRQTMNGAAPVWGALESAKEAAETLGRDEDAQRYEQRLHELGQAIDSVLYDEENGAYGTKRAGFAYSETVWPIQFRPYTDPETAEIQAEPQVEDPLDHPRIQSHLSTDAEGVGEVFEEPEAGEIDTGQYEVKALIPLSKARRESGLGSLDLVRDGIGWLATEHAEDDTHVMGEAWKVFEDENGDREVRSIVGQPHVWEQVLLYLTTLETYPPADLTFDEDSIGGVLEALRRTDRSD